jgi:hypothetical protein
MSVGQDYLTKQPSRPSAPKLFFDTKIIPGAVNAAGSIEGAVNRLSTRTGVRPMVILAGGCFGFIALCDLLRTRRTAP